MSKLRYEEFGVRNVTLCSPKILFPVHFTLSAEHQRNDLFHYQDLIPLVIWKV